MRMQRANVISTAHTADVTLPANQNRTALVVHATAGVTIELGKGGGAFTVAAGEVYEPRVVPISEVTIVGTDFILAQAG